MIDERDRIDFIETERYERFERPGYKFHFDRRDFIKAFGVGMPCEEVSPRRHKKPPTTRSNHSIQRLTTN